MKSFHLFLLLAGAPFVAPASGAGAGTSDSPVVVAQNRSFVARLHDAPARTILADGETAPESVKLTRVWDGDRCRFALTNTGGAPVAVREVVVFDLPHGLPGDTSVYAEGFQKLAMLGGTLANPRDLGSYPDRSHYRIPEPENMRTAYGVFTAAPKGGDRILLASTSCDRFISRFSYDATRLRISFDCENLTLAPGATWNLEAFLAISGPDREALFDRLASAVAVRHPRLPHGIPAGWCSWVCFGPGVTAKNVSDVTAWIATNEPRLKYIQIDDGYQPWMGDWLETGSAFGGGVQTVLKDIRTKGLEPAIWVAPFIASPQSKVFREHPDWFVKDGDGKPLRSDKVGFGGWRQGPWYVLDGTNPEALAHLTHVFKTMREDWGVTYFKLDANYWGAMHGGVHFDKNATRIEAYRRGMEAIRKGAGDAFLLGCNHPLWPSLGLVHGSRSSMDIAPSWDSFRKIAEENLYRAWQNGRFWWNDPDTVVLREPGSKSVMGPDGRPTQTGRLKENEYRFHVAGLFADGGLILSGDDLTKETPAHVEMLKKLLPPTGVAARFPDETFAVGEVRLPAGTTFVVLNSGDKPESRTIPLKGRARLVDRLTGKDYGTHDGPFEIPDFPARDGAILDVAQTSESARSEAR